MMPWEQVKRAKLAKMVILVRNLMNENCNHTANFVDERAGIGGGVEFRMLTRAHGEVLVAIRVEPS